MIPVIEIDTTAFRKAAQDLIKTSSRSCVDFINGQLLRTSIEAVRQTKAADAAKIEATLGVVGQQFGYKTRGKNKGKIKLTKKIIKDDSFAKRILGARHKLTGNFGFKGVTDINAAVLKLIAARKRSANFIRAGWIPARNALFSVVKKKPADVSRFQGAKTYGKPKGSARPALNGAPKIEGTITNAALMAFVNRNISTGGNPMPVAEKGLRSALDFVTRDMIAKLAERLRGDLKGFGAK